MAKWRKTKATFTGGVLPATLQLLEVSDQIFFLDI